MRSPNRLGAAQVRAVAAVDNLAPGDEVLVVESGPNTRVVSAFSRMYRWRVMPLLD